MANNYKIPNTIMIMKKSFFILLVFISASTIAQVKNRKWQFGVGASVVKFSDEDASYIGDKNLFQIPRLNLTVPINDNLSVDGAISFNSFDIGFIENSAKYFSMDGSLRYSFTNFSDKFFPYVFVGGSLVDSDRKMTPTFNFGAGATYWITDKFGLNTQLYYKYSLESFESMRSHIQITGGIVFAFDSLFEGGGGRSASSVGGACYYNQH